MSPLPLHCVPPDAASARALQLLCDEFFWLVDHGFAERTRHLFTEDVRYHAQGRSSEGIVLLMQRMAERAARREPRTRHVVSGLRLHQHSDAHIEGYSLLIVYRDSPLPALVADVHDRFVRGADGQWRIADRMILPVMEAGGGVLGIASDSDAPVSVPAR